MSTWTLKPRPPSAASSGGVTAVGRPGAHLALPKDAPISLGGDAEDILTADDHCVKPASEFDG